MSSRKFFVQHHVFFDAYCIPDKEKADLVRTVASQEQVLAEMTRQVADLQIEVERERSVSHGLRAELDRLRDYQQTANRGAAIHK